MSDLIPDGWVHLEVQNAFDIGRGRVISKPEIRDNPGPYPVYSSQSKANGKMGAIATYDFDGEYISWTTDGAYAGTVFHRLGKFNCTNVCGTLRDNGKYKVFPKFVASYLSTVAKKHVSYVGNPKLMNGIFAEIGFLLPPLPEQQKIAAILTSVDEVIEKTQAQIDKLKDLKTGMMQQLLTSGVGIDGNPHTEFKDSPVGRIPKGWEVKRLGEVVIIKGLQTGPFGGQLHSHEYVQIGIPVVMPKDMKRNRIVVNSIAKITPQKADGLEKHKIREGDILFSRRGDIGRFALVEKSNDGWLCGTGCLRARLSSSVSPSFFAAYLTLDYVIEWLNNNAVGQTMLNLNTSILSDLPVILPSIEEQKTIAKMITALDQTLFTKERKMLALLNTKKALMQDLLTGKVRVNVASQTSGH